MAGVYEADQHVASIQAAHMPLVQGIGDEGQAFGNDFQPFYSEHCKVVLVNQ